MGTFTDRRCLVVLVLLSLLGLGGMLSGRPADAAIYRWDTAALITDRDAVPGADFSGMDLGYADLEGASLMGASFRESVLTLAHLMDANLTGTTFHSATLTNSDLTGANLTDASFEEATLTNAELREAVVNGAIFSETTDRGFTAEQLYSTASHQTGQLSGIDLGLNDLSGWDFAGQNLTGASLRYATLTDADFTDAVVARANFFYTTTRGFTAEQLYSTARYQTGQLAGVDLGYNNLSGWNFARKNLTRASLGYATLTDADFTDAVVAGANFTNGSIHGFTAEQLYSTASYQTGQLAGINLSSNDLSGWNFAGKNLTGANLRGASLTDADFTDAVVAGARFWNVTRDGLTAEQLYSTASYQTGQLAGISLELHSLRRWNFAGKNLTGANLENAILTDADFSAADLTDANLYGAHFSGAAFSFSDLRGARVSQTHFSRLATSDNAILPDGRIEGLELDAAERLVVRDYELPITVESGMGLDPESTLRMVFEDDDWGSTISFQPDIGVSLGGTLELLFADDVRPADLIGTTFDLFDWDGAIVTGRFDVPIVTESGAIWDRSNLYTTGELTLIPEPSTFMLLLSALLACALRRRKDS